MEVLYPLDKIKTIRSRVLTAITVAFLLIFALLYLVFFTSTQILLHDKEDSFLSSQTRTASSILQASVSSIPNAARDLASWDETYAYVSDANEDFVRENLSDYAFQLNRLNLIALIRTDGSIVYEAYYDHAQAMSADTPVDFSPLYTQLAPLVKLKYYNALELDVTETLQIGMAGFWEHEGALLYVAAYPILHTDESGPVAGTLFFGRQIDDAELAMLREDSGIWLSLTALSRAPFDDRQLLALQDSGVLLLTNESNATNYRKISDIFSRETLLLSVTDTRTEYFMGTGYIDRLLIGIALCCTVALIIIFNLLKKIMITPLNRLVKNVNAVNIETVDAPLPLANESIEFNDLTGAINDLLFRIRTDRDLIRQTNEELFYNANHDTLTGLFNRYSASKYIEQLIELDPARQFSVLFLDLDRFKFINDTLGHSTGDQFIIAVADRLRRRMGPGTFQARVSGDEFLVITGGLRTQDDRLTYAKGIQDVFTAPFLVRERELSASASIGSSLYPWDGRDAEQLIKNAELAMYQAKELGEGLHIAYINEFQAKLQHKVYMENKLRDAIYSGCGEFRAYFQPKVSIATGRIESCEALMRWQTKEGLLPPSAFIPEAEESGLIVPLSWWMLEECCRMVKLFDREGVKNTVSVNIPAAVLMHEDFIPTLTRAAEAAGIDCSRLDIEITESTLLVDMEQADPILDQLHRLGAQISVDDFGTGYSSLSYLNKLNVDRIKIDRSFIANMDESGDDQAIVRAILAMAKSLRMVVTAEGVETEAQYTLLKELRCEEVQGFLISRPIPAEEYLRFCKDWEKKARRAAAPHSGISP